MAKDRDPAGGRPVGTAGAAGPWPGHEGTFDQCPPTWQVTRSDLLRCYDQPDADVRAEVERDVLARASCGNRPTR